MARTARTVVQTPRLRDQVYEILREEIRAGEMEPGQRLMEVELAAKYKVSRTPVREALFQLAREGYVVNGAKGFTLATESPMTLAHRLEVRILLDPALARHAAAEGTEEQLAALTAAHERMKQAHKAGRLGAFTGYGHEFRMLLIRMCNNPVLARCCDVLENQYLTERNDLYKHPGNRDVVMDWNARQLKAILERDPDKAAQVAREFMETLLEFFAKPLIEGKPTQLDAARSPRPKVAPATRKT